MKINEFSTVTLLFSYGSFGAAAKAAGVSVSTLSKRLSKLEEELGAPIFERSTAGNAIKLTESGRALFPLIQKLVNTSSLMQSKLNLIESTSEMINVGMASQIYEPYTSKIMTGFMSESPDTVFYSVYESYKSLVRFLSEGMIDCAFLLSISSDNFDDGITSRFSADFFNVVEIAESDRIFICMSEKDPLALKSSVSIDELKERTLLFNRTLDTDFVNDGENMPFFRVMNVVPDNYRYRFEDYINSVYVRKLLREGAGVMPQFFVKPIPEKGVVSVPLSGWKGTARLLYVSPKLSPPAVESFSYYAGRFVRNNDGPVSDNKS